jgi:PAS domain S-box-containing protein
MEDIQNGRTGRKKISSEIKTDIRQRAEKVHRARKSSNRDVTVPDKDRLLHELEMHQIEMEIQNEDLLRTQLELQESRNRYVELFDFAPVGYFILDKQFLIIEANLTGSRMLGLERSQLLKQRFTRFIAPSSQSAFHLYLMAGKESPERNCELEMNRVKAEPFQAELRIVAFTSADSSQLYRVAVSDITDRKQKEEALKESQLKYQALTEATSDFIWETDSQGRYTYCSPQMKRLWGYAPEEVIGKTPFDFMPPEEREPGIKAFKVMVQARRPFSGIEVNSLDSQGYPITIEISGDPYFDADGRFSGFRGTSRDITERKKAEENILSVQHQLDIAFYELEKSNEQLKSYNRKLIQAQEHEKAKTSNALDDTIQYLFVLKLEMQSLLTKEQNITPEMSTKLGELLDSISRILEIITGKNEKLEPSIVEQIGLVEALQNIVEQFSMLNNIHVDYKFNRPTRLSKEYELALFRIAQEALDNIEKHSRATRAEIKLTINSEEVNLTISDNGQGFDTGRLSETEAAGGINLKMDEWARLIGATLTVKSLIGNGTIVSVKARCKIIAEEN